MPTCSPSASASPRAATASPAATGSSTPASSARRCRKGASSGCCDSSRIAIAPTAPLEHYRVDVEFDSGKDRENRRKHGFSLVLGREILENMLHEELDRDCRIEERWIAYGF